MDIFAHFPIFFLGVMFNSVRGQVYFVTFFFFAFYFAFFLIFLFFLSLSLSGFSYLSCALPPLSCPLSVSIFIRFPLSYSIITEHCYPPFVLLLFFRSFCQLCCNCTYVIYLVNKASSLMMTHFVSKHVGA